MGGRWIDAASVYGWADLQPGWQASGPAIVQQDLATIMVPEGYRAHIGALGDLEMMKE